MFKTMLNAWKDWLAQRKAAKAQSDYDRGYAYGYDALLTGKETPGSLEAKIFDGEKSDFDVGMLAAADELIEAGAVADDTFGINFL